MHEEIMEMVKKLKEMGIGTIIDTENPFITIDGHRLLDMFGNDVVVTPGVECPDMLRLRYKTDMYEYIGAISDYAYEVWQRKQAQKK